MEEKTLAIVSELRSGYLGKQAYPEEQAKKIFDALKTSIIGTNVNRIFLVGDGGKILDNYTNPA